MSRLDAMHGARGDSPPLVLVIDDEPLVRTAATMALRILGYEVLAAPGGAQGAELLRQHPGRVAVVVLDLRMPAMSGRETFVALREVEPRVPVVLTTGMALDDEVYDVLEMGASSVLAKPYDLDTLAEAVDAALASPPSSAVI